MVNRIEVRDRRNWLAIRAEAWREFYLLDRGISRPRRMGIAAGLVARRYSDWTDGEVLSAMAMKPANLQGKLF
jgi:hypothetical protein